MSGVSRDLIAKYAQGILTSQERAVEDLETIEKIQTFMEENPEVIDPIVADVTSIKNLLDNLEVLLQENPSCKSTIEKIKNTVETTLIKKHLKDSPEKIEKYKDLNPAHLKELISEGVKNDEWKNPHSIQKITDQKIRIEVVKGLAERNAWEVSDNIQNYGIKDPSAFIEIARAAAAQNPHVVAEFLGNYFKKKETSFIFRCLPDFIGQMFEDNQPINQASLVSFLKELAVKSGERVSKNIDNCGVSAEADRIEIAKVIALQFPDAVARCLSKYKITDQAKVVAFLKDLAAQDGDAVSEYFSSYNIPDEKDRIEIAKIAAAQNGWGVSEYIGDYKIKDESARIEIAKIAEAQNPYKVAEFLDRYHITDQAALIEIVKNLVAKAPKIVAKQLQEYGIADQAALVEIAKILAERDGDAIVENIRTYGIKDQSDLVEIAKVVIVNNLEGFLPRLSLFCLNSNFKASDDYKKLLLMGLAYRLPYMDNGIFGMSEEVKELIPLVEEGRSQKEKESLLRLKNPIAFFKECIERFELSLPEELKKNAPIQQALQYRNKEIAYPLIGEFVEGSASKNYQEAYLSLAGKNVTPRLPSILPAKWMAASEISQAPENLLNFLKRYKSQLKNKDTGLMQMYLLTALSLDKLENIPPREKLELLSSICSRTNTQDVLKGLSYLYVFAMRKEVEILKGLTFQNEPIQSVLAKAFEKMLLNDPLVDMSNVSDISDFIDSYLESFTHTRIPLALEVYKAKISTLNDEQVKDILKRFISSIVLKTFDEERFRTDISPHLGKIESNDVSLFNAWKALKFSAPVSGVSRGAEQASFSFRNFFDTKLQDRHWFKNGIDVLPDLTAYLKGKVVQNPNDPIFKSSRELIENQALSKEKQIEKIKEILVALEDPNLRGLEFKNDLEGLIGGLNSKDQDVGNEKVVLSRDWQDLFLSGTEVVGSCQRIDGDPSLNKCLLAYCMDGKNAMVAVKDYDGKTLARSMLRLLWNEKEQKPALFLDRLYPNPCPVERKKAIVEAATACAKQLKCDLFTKWDGYPSSPDAIVKSLGSSCPYEYADAAEGVMANGIFEIKDPRKV